jgi:hypothetical protein
VLGFPGAAFVLDFDPEHPGVQARVDGEGPSGLARVAVQNRTSGELGQARQRVRGKRAAIQDRCPAAAAVLFLFPLLGLVDPHADTLVNLLPFGTLGWLGLGIIAVGVLRARQPATFQTLGKVFMPGESQPNSSRPLPRGFPPDRQRVIPRDPGQDDGGRNDDCGGRHEETI